MKSVSALIAVLVLVVMAVPPAFGWGHAGHEVVGSIADQMLGPNARRQVSDIMGFELRIAGPWADCVKSVVHNPDGTFTYKIDPAHPEYRIGCEAFEPDAEKARMEDYVGRNWDDCFYKAGRGCHETYHFDDVAIQHDRYDRAYKGTNEHDLVSAINAAISVLRDTPVSAPFSIVDKKEALLLLAHFLGDLHQPLHVGAVYLDAAGNRLDPDSGAPFDEHSETAGGNSISDQHNNFHTEWDAIPADLGRSADAHIVAAAEQIAGNPGAIENWARDWASETVQISQSAFAGATFSPVLHGRWDVSFDDRNKYLDDADMIKRNQLAKAGARLAQLLNAIWP